MCVLIHVYTTYLIYLTLLISTCVRGWPLVIRQFMCEVLPEEN